MNRRAAEFLRGDAGWTFIETVIVVSIVMFLTATVGVMTSKSIDKARSAAARAQIDTFCTALESYYVDCGCYPTEEQGLAALRKRPETEPSSEKWSGPYLFKDVPKDPWGGEYEYLQPGPDVEAYGVRCLGADKMLGGEGWDADIASWEIWGG